MPYANEGIISEDPLEGGIEITKEQFDAALEGMQIGKVVTIDGGFKVDFPPEPELPEPEIIEEPPIEIPQDIPPPPVMSPVDKLQAFLAANPDVLSLILPPVTE